MESPQVRYTKSGDVSIAYATIGDGPFDLVFVGGWVLSAFEAAWEGPAADTMRRLSSFSRLILFDKRGTGASDRSTGVPNLETRMDRRDLSGADRGRRAVRHRGVLPANPPSTRGRRRPRCGVGSSTGRRSASARRNGSTNG